MDPNSASAGAPKSGKDKEKKSKKNYEEGDGKKKFVSVMFLSLWVYCQYCSEASGRVWIYLFLNMAVCKMFKIVLSLRFYMSH